MKKLITFFKKDKRRLDILLILLLGCLVFTWFEKDYIFTFGDYRFNLSPSYFNLSKFFYVWDDLTSLGSFNNAQTLPDVFPNQLAIFILAKLGLSVWLIQRLIFYFIFCTAGIGAYYLGWQLFKKRLAGLVCALFYLFNLSILVVGWTMMGTMMYFYPFTPWLAIFYIKLTNSRNNYWKYILMLSLIFVLSLPAAKVAIYPILNWFIFLPYLIFYLFLKINKGQLCLLAIKKTLILLVIWLGLNAFWITPYAFNLNDINNSAFNNPAVASSDPIDSLRGSTKKAYLLNSIRLLDYGVFSEKFMGVDLFYKYSATINNRFFTALSFLPALLAFSAFLLSRNQKQKNTTLFFTVLAVIYLYIEKGINPPLSGILAYLVKNNVVFSSLRNPLNKISVLLTLSYAVLIAFSVSQIYEHLKRKKSKSIARITATAIVLLINVVLVYPFWTGQVFSQAGKIYRSSLIKVPKEYQSAANKLKLLDPQCQYRILGIPVVDYFGIAFDWSAGYDSLDPKRYLFCQSSVTIDNLDLVKRLNNILRSDDLPPWLFTEISNYLGIKYFILHNDIALNYFNFNRSSFRDTRQRIQNNYYDNVKKLFSFGQLDIYENQSQNLAQKIYIPDKLVSASEFDLILAVETSELVNLPSHILLDKDQVFPAKINERLNWQTVFFQRPNYFLDQGNAFLVLISNNLPKPVKFSFKKITPTKYQVMAGGVPEFFFLNFNEKFDRNWKIYQKPKNLGIKLINLFEREYLPEANHFTTNLHSNGWLIQPEQGEEKLELIIEYKTQRLVYFGLTLTFLTLLVLAERLWLILKKNNG